MKGCRIGGRIIPLWPVMLMLICSLGLALAYVVWTLNMQVEVQEPIHVLYCPSELSLYPGETAEFEIVLDNWASVDYSVTLDFHLSSPVYESSYVTFSNETYIVVPGEQSLIAWVKVAADAPATNVSLIVDLSRGAYPLG